MQKFRAVILGISLILMILLTGGCGGSDSTSKTVEVTDQIGDVAYDFMDLKKGVVVFDGNNIGIQMEMVNLPDKLIFNHAGLGLNYMEYLWGVVFDLDGDGQKSLNDIEIAITYIKRDNNPEAESEILGKAQAYIWRVTQNSGITALMPITGVTKNGNSFIVNISKSMNSSLNGINSNCKLMFETYYEPGGVRPVQDDMEN